jgi:hypothetical protein
LSIVLALVGGCGGSGAARTDGAADRPDGGGATDGRAVDDLAAGAAGAREGEPGPDDSGAEVGDGPALSCLPERTLTAAQSATYLPLAVGNRWNYRIVEHAPGSSDRVSQQLTVVSGTATVDGKQAFVVTDSLDPSSAGVVQHYLEVASNGIIDHGTDPASSDPGAAYGSPPYTEIQFPIQVCSAYPQFTTLNPLGQTVTASAVDRAFESSAVKVGTFADALAHQRNISYATSEDGGPPTVTGLVEVAEWYAPGVGRTRRHVGSLSLLYDYEQSFDYELTGALVGGVGRGVLPLDTIAADIPVDAPPQLGLNSPAIASDGTHFLVVQGSNTSFSDGGLVATLVGADGVPITSAPLFHGMTAPYNAAAAFGNGHYLVVYAEVNLSPLNGIFVSTAGAAEGAPFSITPTGGTGAVVAFVGGKFVVAQTGTTAMIFNILDAQGNVAQTTAYSSTNAAGLPAIASDGTNLLVGWTTINPPATLGFPNTHVTVGRIDANGNALDPAASVVSNETGTDESVDVAFDGDHYVVVWMHRPDPSLLDQGSIRAARVGTNGVLLDGAPNPAGGHVVSPGTEGYPSQGNPRVVRFGSQALVVWHWVNSYDRRILGSRLASDGTPLDVPPTDPGLWISPEGDYTQLASVAFSGDRALVAFTEPGSDPQAFTTTLKDALLFPW